MVFGSHRDERLVCASSIVACILNGWGVRESNGRNSIRVHVFMRSSLGNVRMRQSLRGSLLLSSLRNTNIVARRIAY